MLVKLMIDAGDMKPNPAISQKLGPLGLNLGKIIQDVNTATQTFKGIKVPVTLDIDTKTKTFKVEVSTPPVSNLLKKEFGLEKGSGTPNAVKVYNASLEEVVSVTKVKQHGMLSKDFKSALKSVLGTCISLGILVENKDPREVTAELDTTYKDIVENEIAITSPDKKAKLNEFFERIKSKQEAEAKKKAEEEAAKEAEKAAAAAAAPVAGATAAPGTPAAAGEKAAAAPATAKDAKKEMDKKK